MKKRYYFACLALLFLNISLSAQYEKQIQLAEQYLQQNKEKWDLTAQDVADIAVYNAYETKHNGVTHLYFNQRYSGIDIYNAIYNANLLPNGKVFFVGNRFHANIVDKVNTIRALLSPEDAIQAAVQMLEIEEKPNLSERELDGKNILFKNTDISEEDIRVHLVYQPMEDGQLKLAWQLAIRMQHTSDYWNLRLDAQDGTLLKKDNYTRYCTFPKHNHAAGEHCTTSESRSFSKTTNSFFNTNNADGSTYNVFPVPVESPIHGDRAMVQSPALTNASPYGWHDTDGVEGPEYTITRGNNVHAYADLGGGNISSDTEPDGGENLQFDFPYDGNTEPLSNQDAAVTQLFYMSNIMHDLAYQYGFDEVAGNFQENNYGNGGLEGDGISSEALDNFGSVNTGDGSVNNANYSGGPDGSSGRIQMFVWNRSGGKIAQIVEPAEIATSFDGGTATFGPSISSNPVMGEVAVATDGTLNGTLACNSITNRDEVDGKIALIDRGTCFFVEKVRNAQNAGAIAVIVCNFEDAIISMGGDNASDITIPSIFMQRRDCQTIRQVINDGLVMQLGTVEEVAGPEFISGSFDNGIIAHEYAHGISDRLVGGPNQASCLLNSEQMGEGWSDFFALITTVKLEDRPETRRGVGTYALRQNTAGQGVRNFPYSTDLETTPYTYADIIGEGVHETGAVWNAMLWDLYWAMSDEYGWDPDPFNGTGGNNRAIQLVMDGLKLTPCSPGFVDARDAILAADEANYGGANQCLIWEVFARRGLGFSADQGNRNQNDAFEGYDVRPQCITELKIAKEVTDFINPGEEINVTVTVTNHKGEAVTDVVVTDFLPDGLTLVSGSNSLPVTVNNNQIVFNIDELANDESQVITYTLASDSEMTSISQFFDGGENGDDIWLYIDVQGTDIWALTDDFPRTGDFSWSISDADEDNHQIMLLDESIELNGSFPTLRFYHWYNTAVGDDSGLIEISTDGGTVWTDVAPFFIRNGYVGEASYSSFAEPNRSAFWGNSQDYIPTYVDLRPFLEAGEIMIRFRFGSTSGSGNSEWLIDDIEFLDLLNYNSEVCATSAEGDNVCAVAEAGGTIVETAAMTTSVNDLEEEGLVFNVFPNPAGDFLNISLNSEDTDESTVTLFNMNGQSLLQQHITLSNTTQIIPFNVSQLASGFYFIEVRTNAGVAMKKIILD